MVVFAGLVATLTVTSALLLAMQPAPLDAEAGKTLMSLSTPADVGTLFDTRAVVRPGRWKYVYVHHAGAQAAGRAATTADNAPFASAPDHFVIGNGQGLVGDGEVQVGPRWDGQQAAGRTPGLDRVDPDCISIGLAGDLDRTPPSPRQVEQLGRLVSSLQTRLRIGRDRVWVVEAPGLAAGCGRYFPRDGFRENLLP